VPQSPIIMSAGPDDQPQAPPASAAAPAAKDPASPPPPHQVPRAPDANANTSAHELQSHADATASLSTHSSSATTGLPFIGSTAVPAPAIHAAPIHVVQPSTYLGTYVRPRGLAERPMTPSTLVPVQAPPPLSLVDREQIEGLVGRLLFLLFSGEVYGSSNSVSLLGITLRIPCRTAKEPV
jgi:hypothetical protein